MIKANVARKREAATILILRGNILQPRRRAAARPARALGRAGGRVSRQLRTICHALSGFPGTPDLRITARTSSRRRRRNRRESRRQPHSIGGLDARGPHAGQGGGGRGGESSNEFLTCQIKLPLRNISRLRAPDVVISLVTTVVGSFRPALGQRGGL
ncbi:hypothetical protein EVAR_29297_1 [Eumeta japonica]|uniref:Uncharacterized protein n=1 Tax=Eumeta variegata TaxID=151549 RepID=A0A4C1VX35_EUMVA|nr:hypothetical protein EVAR_29297_1 [Eumeta japonica]